MHEPSKKKKCINADGFYMITEGPHRLECVQLVNFHDKLIRRIPLSAILNGYDIKVSVKTVKWEDQFKVARNKPAFPIFMRSLQKIGTQSENRSHLYVSYVKMREDSKQVYTLCI